MIEALQPYESMFNMTKILPGLGLGPHQIDKAQVAFYRQHGYLKVAALFSSGECDAILELAKGCANENYGALLNLDREIEEIRSVMKAPKIVSILETLQGAEVVGLQSQTIFKMPGSPFASQSWNVHQDNAYFQSADGVTLNCHIALADHDVENGCLFGYAGSHREGILLFEPTISHNAKPGENPGNKVPKEAIEKYAAAKVDFILKKGDVAFMEGNMFHGSYPNCSPDRARPVLTLCYITKGEHFEPGRTAKRVEISLRWDK
jgi:ectoine hydroxylase-related dioxygenase (phytanoyl-CoA dioxygenase family)